jgi:hypothetical protein
MKPLLAWTAQAAALLAGAAVLAAPLACLAALSAPLHSPGYAARFLCPPGSLLESEWYQATYNEPGERTLSVTCVDAAGQPVAANPRDERTLLNGVGLYFPVCFAPVLVLGAILLLAVNGLLRARRPRAAKRADPA